MRLAALIVPLAALALSSCQTPCANTNPSTTTLNYHCADGSDLQVAFTTQPDSAHVVQEGYAPLDLPPRITGSGYRYAREGAELRGRGQEVRWARPGAAETLCQQTP